MDGNLTFAAIDDDENYDVTIGPLALELSCKDGRWMFWGVRIGATQIGGSQILAPSEFVQWLDAERDDALIDASPMRAVASGRKEQTDG